MDKLSVGERHLTKKKKETEELYLANIKFQSQKYIIFFQIRIQKLISGFRNLDPGIQTAFESGSI